MAQQPQPTSATLRAYQVGFGDCFLLTFHYTDDGHRHVLIDFGSTGLAEAKTRDDQFLSIAQDIRTSCNSKLDVVIATHRHKDHISGFATKENGSGPGDIIAACHPNYVIQPWTEDPDAGRDASTATTEADSDRKSFVASLGAMHQVSEAILAESERLRNVLHPQMSAELSFLGDDNLSNRAAVENLIQMGKKGKAFYVNYGSQLDEVLPGVKITVLGPPDLTQSQETRKQRARDKDEFWQLQANVGTFVTGGSPKLFEDYEACSEEEAPPYTRWLIEKIQRIRGEQLLGIVRALDKAMNNTSVILLFEVGDKKLLFPGDAQIENWSYALKKKENQDLLKSVNLYKVGHHGSLNATPKGSLWKLFNNRSSEHTPRRLQTVVSTMAHKHGDSRKHTEVPRTTLVAALESESDFFTTQNLKGALAKDIEIHFFASGCAEDNIEDQG